MTCGDRTIATIDLGSNSILLLIVHRNDQGQLHVLREGSEVVKLGEKIRDTGNITAAALDRTISALKQYQFEIQKFAVDKVYLTATSAMREAGNQKQIIKAILRQTGLEVEVLPKLEEARLTYLSVLTEEPHAETSLVVDIGGGSTEISWGIGARYEGGRSLNIGTVKLIEGPLSKAQITEANISAARAEIDNELGHIAQLGPLKHYYGTAGSFTQAAALELELEEFSPKAVDHFRLKKENVEKWITKISKMSQEEIMALPGIDPKRTDLLLAGLVVIERLYNKFGMSEFIVRDRGVKYGKAFDQFRDFKPEIIFS
jgi:exopolyphosphatase/guanosine-5'-triphosphate,3'-diphosphate pyrophosphatase